MTISVGIIGAGWYGCHIGETFKNLGFNVVIFEKEKRILAGASGNNQFRLHMGFHYARHYGTRMQSRDGFMRFIERYPSLTSPVEENIYAVPKEDSLIDFLTYRSIMTASGIEFQEVQDVSINITGIEGMIKTKERVILVEQSREYFSKKLGPIIQLNQCIEDLINNEQGVWLNGQRFDFVIDATWGHLQTSNSAVIYEPTILMYYEAFEKFPAVTLVDGPLCSIYPTDDPKIYTLSSVLYTPINQYQSAAESRDALKKITSHDVNNKRLLMEKQIQRYIPNFSDNFKFLGPQFSIKTKPIGKYDDRSCNVTRNRRVFSVQSGKIDTIFFAVDRILSLMNTPETNTTLALSTIRNDIKT